MSKSVDTVNSILDAYNFSLEDKKNFISITESIYNHKEFIKRMDSKAYPHHGNKSLGDHILSDAAVTYKLAKKNANIDVKLAVVIAMFHDLYELSWQNSGIKQLKFINKHGFIHPIEAIINASIWFPTYFKNEDDALIIIDGVIHHMYPFPVRRIKNGFEEIEINNLSKLSKVDPKIEKLIVESTNRGKLGGLSFAKAKYKEGRIIAKADKLVSIKGEIKSFHSLFSLITGVNPELDNYKKK